MVRLSCAEMRIAIHRSCHMVLRQQLSMECWVHLSRQVSLGMAELDVAAILQQQRIMLQGVPLGVGRIVFTASQFGSFLRHPLMTQAAAAAVQVSNEKNSLPSYYEF